MPAPVEILGQRQLRVRDRHFEMFFSDPPRIDGSIYNLEANGQDDESGRTHLEPYELRGVLGKDLPNALSISIYRPKSHLGNMMCMVDFENLNQGPVTKAVICLDQVNWHLPMHLADFCDELSQLIASAKDLVTSTNSTEDEGSIYITVTAPIGPTVDCYAVFQSVDELILRSYRGTLRMFMRETPARRAKESPAPPADTHGPRWWIRYVVVPVVLGGLTIAALLLR